MKQEDLKIGEYIESGILESYVLGMLNANERAEVEAMADKHPEVKAVLLELEETLGDMALAESVAPPTGLKENILAAAFAEEDTPLHSLPADEPMVKPLPDVEFKERPKSSLNFMAIAASVVLLLSLGININQYQSLQTLKKDLHHTEMRVAELESENQVMVANFKDVEQNLAVLRDPNTATFIMRGVEGRDPNYRANIYWNSSTETVYLDVKALPKAPQGKQYQLWALKDGKPIDMGVFNALDTEQVLLKMGSIPGADAFAVTLEKAGGVPSPTLEEMYVYGEPVQS